MTDKKIPDVSGKNRTVKNGRINGKFAPGVSGNPKGRPKNVQNIPELLRKIGREEVTKDGKTKLEVILRVVYREAMQGRYWAVQFIADRTEGKAKQIIENIEQNQITEIIMV